MSDDAQDDPVYNEPVVTGWLQTVIRGDIELGKTHLRAARAQLGALRITNGVNERVARGDAGGFYTVTRTLEDGTRIRTTTNDNQDVIYIDARREREQAREEHAVQPVASNGNADQLPFANPVSHVPIPTDFPLLKQEREDEVEEEEKKEEEPVYYMWVGIRYADDQPERAPYDAIAMMIEPDYIDQAPDGNGQGQLLCTHFGYGGDAGYDTDTVDLDEFDQLLPWWFSNDRIPVGAGDYYLAWHNPYVGFSYDDVWFTRNGLRLYGPVTDTLVDHGDYLTEEHLIEDHGPYDPIPQDQQPQGYIRKKWDFEFLLDPYELTGEHPELPSDPREWSNKLLELMLRSGVADGEDQVLEGDYYLKLGSLGPTESWDPNRCVYSEDRTYNFNPGDKLDIEVRLWVEGELQRDTFSVQIESASEDFRYVWPYGDQCESLCDGCGENPMAENWWPGALRIDVRNGTVEMLDRYMPSPIFNGGGLLPRWPIEDPLIYLTTIGGFGGSSNAGFVLYNLLECMNNSCACGGSGSWITRWSEAEIGAAAARDIAGALGNYTWDVRTNIFTYVNDIYEGSYPGNYWLKTADGQDIQGRPAWMWQFHLQALAQCEVRTLFWADASAVAWGGFDGILVIDPEELVNKKCC